MKRVDMDTKRNSRSPKSISVGYTMTPGKIWFVSFEPMKLLKKYLALILKPFLIGGAWIGRTFRLPFPADKDFNSRVQKLVDDTRRVLNERGHSSIIRIGFSAIDFVNRPKHGIDMFFSTNKSQQSPAKTVDKMNPKSNSHKSARTKSAGINCYFYEKRKNSDKFPHDIHKERNLSDEDFARQLQQSLNGESQNFRSPNQIESQISGIDASNFTTKDYVSRDESIALQLQTEYDRENRVLSDVERFSNMTKRKGKSISSSRHKKLCDSKSSKIDSFFGGPKTPKY